jgi:hypothetical protein
MEFFFFNALCGLFLVWLKQIALPFSLLKVDLSWFPVLILSMGLGAWLQSFFFFAEYANMPVWTIWRSANS